MKVLFVCSGNHGLSPIVSAQAESLVKAGHEVVIHMIIGKGLVGYLSNIPRLFALIRKSSFDIVHAHYSFCGIVSALSSPKKIVCSLMGSDVIQSGAYRSVIRFFAMHIWAATIVKSQSMKDKLGIESTYVVPNGIDLEHFLSMDKELCKQKLGWEHGKIALFLADPQRPEKNYFLALQSVDLIPDLTLKVVSDAKHADVPMYLNAADVVLLSSLWEGSPNVVKEAMACNVRVVSTRVGDVPYLFGDTPGYILCESNPDAMADAINKVLCVEQAHGRDRIIDLGLNSEHVVAKLIDIYRKGSGHR